MITIILAIAAGCGCFAAAHFSAGVGIGWSVFDGLVAAVGTMAILSFFIMRRVKRDMERVQAIMTDGQKRLQQKMERWRIRPPGSMQAAQREIFEDTKVFVKAAIEETSILEKYRCVSPMMSRQIATARLQLSWMIKDFKTVDKLMPKAICIDPTMCAMKMARLYMLEAGTDEIAKVYRKAVARTRYNGNVLLAATMSWVQVRRNDIDGAFKTLTEALKKSDNETLKKNHECLMNNRAGHFNNSGIGDQWYALFLEEPRVRMQRQHSVYR